MTDRIAKEVSRGLRGTGLTCLIALPLAIGAQLTTPSQPAQAFHTEPSCWNEPRVYHTGKPPAELADRVTVIDAPAAVTPSDEAVVSPNDAYRFWVRHPDTTQPGPWGAGLVINAERDRNTVLLFNEVSGTINPSWVNEKLIFVRVPWGRVTFTDLVFDVEQNTIVYQEQAVYGDNAFTQYQEACGDACPCEPTAQTVDTEPNPLMPAALPGEDAMIGILALPAVFGPQEQEAIDDDHEFVPTPVPVYASPEQGARKLAELATPADFETKEYGYEIDGVVVYDQRPGWYRIGLRDGLSDDERGWLSAKSAADFHPIGELLTRRLAYLNQHWNRKLWQTPTTYRGWNSRLKTKMPDVNGEIPVQITDSLTIGDGLWLQIETLRDDPCQGGNTVTVDRGWIPAYADTGELVAGFYSRGC